MTIWLIAYNAARTMQLGSYHYHGNMTILRPFCRVSIGFLYVSGLYSRSSSSPINPSMGKDPFICATYSDGILPGAPCGLLQSTCWMKFHSNSKHSGHVVLSTQRLIYGIPSYHLNWEKRLILYDLNLVLKLVRYESRVRIITKKNGENLES